MLFNPALAHDTLKEQNDYQLKALKALLEYVQNNSPYYRDLFTSHRINIENIKTLSDISFIPTTTKTDMQEHNWEFLCVNDRHVKEYAATSGTKGKPVTIALTANDLRRLAYGQHQSLHSADGKPGDIYQLMLTLDNLFMAGMAQYMGVRELDAAIVRTGPGHPGMQWDTIFRLQANSLVALPSFIMQLASWAHENDIVLNDSPIQKAICIGESIRGADLELNALGERICNDWNIKLYNTYASTEMQTSFTECGYGNGCHHQPDLIIFEILNDHGDMLHPGEYGEVVITTLGVEGMPLIRYRTGDICTYYDTPCACGRKTRRLSPVLGRKQQMIKYKGTTLYPSAIFDILNQISFVKEYIVEAYTGMFDTEELKLHIKVDHPSVERESMMLSTLQARLRDIPNIQFHDDASIKQLQSTIAGSESGKFIDNRKGIYVE